MTRRTRLLRIAIAFAAVMLVIGVAAVVVVQTDWFRNYVRQKIITATEAGTGGRVELESFSFSPRRLEAVVTNFVIHGKEPQGAEPWNDHAARHRPGRRKWGLQNQRAGWSSSRQFGGDGASERVSEVHNSARGDVQLVADQTKSGKRVLGHTHVRRCIWQPVVSAIFGKDDGGTGFAMDLCRPRHKPPSKVGIAVKGQ